MEPRVSGVGTIDKGVWILGAVEASGPCALADLVAATGLSRATTHRLAVALEAHGLLRRTADGRFALGLRLVGLGRAAADGLPLAEVAGPALLDLRDTTGESVQLFVRDGDQRVCVASLESPHGLRTIVPMGAALPLDRGSAGRVLAGADPGWVESVEERERGVASVSAPVRDPDGTVIAAVSVSGPIERTTRTPGGRYGPAVAAAAAAIERVPGEVVTDAPLLAAIDIGTNSVHLVVARAMAADRFEIIAREKDMVRLGHGGGEMKRLADDAVDRAVAALGRQRAIAEAHGAEVRAVATSAVREAENRHVFLRRAAVEAGVRVEVISGFEEARLIHLGVLQAVPVYERRVLVIDIGGGSTEIVLGEADQAIVARSLKLGAIRLTDRFFPDGVVKPKAVTRARRHIQGVLAPMQREIDRFDVAVASSGTAQSVAAMVLARRGVDPVPTLNQVVISSEELTEVVASLVAAPTVGDRRKIAGLDAGRADIIVAGSLVLEEVLAAFGAGEVMISESALREGVLADTYQRSHGGSLHHLRDIRRRGVLHLAELTDDDPEHSERSAHLALELFDQLSPWHDLDDGAREYLEAAALLCNVGLFISHSGHHKHSYYVIRNSEHLTGFTDAEIEVIAQVARYHRKSPPKAKHEAFVALDDTDQQLVRTLAGILRVAIGLDRAHRGSVGTLRCFADDERVVIEIEPAGGADTTVEVWSADERKGLLAEVLGRPVDVRVRTTLNEG